MKITAQTVCVDYAPQLARCLPIWRATLDRLLVVTAERDADTIALCRSHGVETFLTDAFWRHGAKFNKGLAIAEAFGHLRPDGWHLFFDADILPPADWVTQLERFSVASGALYGSDRYLESGELIREGEIAGAFHLAHSDDPPMQVRPIVDTCWQHAGVYDSTFQRRWPPARRIKLPLRLTHIGQPFTNWCGVGRQAEIEELWRERRRRGGSYQHERIAEPPPPGSG